MARRKFAVDETKLRELIVHLANRADELSDLWFGAVKLNKLLYFTDFIAFQRLKSPVTGATYQKLSEGPAPREFLIARAALIESEDIRLERRSVFNYIQQRIVATRKADLSVFSPHELEIVEEVYGVLLGKTAAEVSELSHRQPGWILAEMGEDIPYETALIQPGPVPAESIDTGHAAL